MTSSGATLREPSVEQPPPDVDARVSIEGRKDLYKEQQRVLKRLASALWEHPEALDPLHAKDFAAAATDAADYVRVDEYSRIMRALSPTQLSTLRKIEEFGLIVPTVTLDRPFAMAHLDLPWPWYEIARVQTARRLARDAFIAPLEYTPPPGEVIIEWEITGAGRELLRDLDAVRVAAEVAS